MLLSVSVVLVVGTLLFTLFVRSQDVPEAPAPSPTAHLEERKAQIYENLRDLQFEYRVGKLSDADYQQTKLTLQKELAGVLSEIDRITQATGRMTPQTASAPKSPAAGAKTQEKRPTPGANVCPHCGAKFPKPMKFCGECGKAMG
jgi:hypothetical protein